MEVESKPSKQHRFVRLFLVMAMLATPFILDVATAEPADAGYVCNSGWQMNSNNMCSRRTYKATHGCNAGWNTYNSSQCYRTQQYCPSGGYLSGGRCHISFWGRPGQYTPSTRFVLQPKTTSYRWVTEWQAPRWVNTYTPRATTTTYSSAGTIIDGMPPAGNTIWANGCQPRVVNSLELRRTYNDHSHINDGGSTGWFRDLAVIDRNNMLAGCTTNGGTMYRYHVEYRKTARVACTMWSSGHGASCDAANWRYDANLWGQGPGHNNVR